jgi:SAM-dependent methyltransferase
MSSAPFDPVAYKRTTTDQWQTAAEPWHRWAPTLEAWLGAATETMLDMAGVARKARVLDVAAGAGGQTLAAARRVGPDGHVLATDISSNILAFAERSAREAGLRNVETRVLDGEQLDVKPGTFDAVISRVGFIYFPDQHAAFVGMRLALRPGGRLAGIVYSTPEANGFFSIPVSVIRRRAQLPAPAEGQPGPFSLGAPGVIEAALERAGLTVGPRDALRGGWRSHSHAGQRTPSSSRWAAARWVAVGWRRPDRAADAGRTRSESRIASASRRRCGGP